MKNVNKKFTDTNIRVNCRFSYMHVFTPRAADPNQPGSKPKYDCCIVIPKSDEQAVAMVREAEEAAKKLYAEKFGKPKSKLKSVVYDGDEERPDDEVVAGCIFINTSSPRQPGVKMLEGGMLVDALDEEDVYSGCYGAADINFFPYSAPTANGIGCGLNNILKLEDGDRLGGGSRNADAAFADLV